MKKTAKVVKDVLKNTKVKVAKATTLPKLPKKVIRPTKNINIFKMLMDLVNKISLWVGTLSLIIKLINIICYF